MCRNFHLLLNDQQRELQWGVKLSFIILSYIQKLIHNIDNLDIFPRQQISNIITSLKNSPLDSIMIQTHRIWWRCI